jgi:TRAP-type C4-dicarboxylate transport system permease small subunit
VLEKFEKFNQRISGWFEWVGVAGLLLIVVITGVDVVGAKLFSWRVFGAIDIVMLSQLTAIAFAAAMTLIIGRHVHVDFIVKRLPQRAQAVINSIVLLLQLGLFFLIIWRLCVQGYSFQTTGESSATAYIPLYPFAYGIAFSGVLVFLVLLQRFLSSLVRVVKR